MAIAGDVVAPRPPQTPSPPPSTEGIGSRPVKLGRTLARAREPSGHVQPTPVAAELLRSSRKVASRRPQTHCGTLLKDQGLASWTSTDVDLEHDFGPDAPYCTAAGAAALASIGSCRSCLKLRLRLETAERARVQAQEQLARIKQENLRLRGVLPIEVSTNDSRDTSPNMESYGTADFNGASQPLEDYRREVALLQQRLQGREANEAVLLDKLRRQRLDDEAAREDLESKVAMLLCEVQDLEARNRQLETS